MRLYAAVGLGAIATVLAVACSSEDITLATLPPDTDAGRPMEKTRCVNDTDCPSTAFCGRKSCDEVGGFCFERPVVCSGDVDPVCGCDGVTYWNDCTRRLAGATAEVDGACELDSAQICSFDIAHPGAPVTPITTCPAGTFCARLFPAPGGGSPDCPVTSNGTCWFLPTVCPTEADNERWTKCGADDVCHTTCDAIRSGDAYQHAMTCP